ncbi:cytochrome d ubiquinol oxidase subunit II [Enterococcus plantarum]|uniref:cytochrome d ubiquinol oxidase subunit II n=1 Tax=Enterococcus plantarum TaxID=1077675 RepID=UPI00084D1CB5|nr:cytochrome d ubiquinol oxidase subunit II [Enterococcus plantarum]OEG10022.1 cytochrome d ubiquinol oxidase subunit II [Enterococcus plantarum]
MSTLQLLWFVLIGILFSGFFFLEGFDFGVGMSVQTLAHDEEEKEQIIQTIGPVWDGNEVWLLTAGGAMFASFPYWYASLFSGFYLILFIILVGLIIRGVSFEFRHRMPDGKRRRMWNWTLSIGSFIVPFFFGVLFIDLVQGMPLDVNGNMMASFTDYINVFSVVGGVALSLLCYLHGLNYITLKTEGPVRERARNYASFFYWVLYVGLVVFAALLYFKTDFFDNHFLVTMLLVVVIVALTVVANVSVFKKKEMLAFLASGLTLILLVALLFSGLFPRVMIGSEGYYDILIQDASSSPYTLKTMTWLSLTILPFVLAYTGWSYYVFRKRIKHPAIAAVGYEG